MSRTSRSLARKPHAGGKRPPPPSQEIAALFTHAFALHREGRLEEAAMAYEQVLEKDPQDFDALHLLGVIAARSRNPSRAVDLIGRAIAVNPGVAAAHSNLGAALKELKRLEEAVASYERAIQIDPNTPQAYSNRGNALQELRRMKEAVDSYDRALTLKPDYAEAWYNRANALRHLKRLEEASASFERALVLQPDLEFVTGTLIHTYHQIGDWQGFEENNRQLQVLLERGQRVTPPFPVLAIFDEPRLQHIAAQVWVQAKCPAQATLGPLAPARRKERLRLGYYSADFHDHATSYLMAELFESHDRDRFELIAFSFGPDASDAMRQRVSSAFDRFIDVRSMSDLEVARLSRELGIDVAVDLKGHTQDARPGIFAYRCAPVQVNYLGYPGTMGAPYMDYLIADHVLVSEQERDHFTEKIVSLPHSYQVNDTKRVIAQTRWTREQLGLPQDAFVFCCFNNSFKITPQTFDSWVRILHAVPGSVLWLLEDNSVATRNLQQAALARGLSPHRLVFAPRIPLDEHLARHRLADLFLDTLPCNAHTTASDALWAGLPVLTLAGRAMAARVAASLLTAIGLPELITLSQEDYERLAIALATDPGRLAALRETLCRHRASAPLYDIARFTRHIESAYEVMHARHLAGLSPAHLSIPA